MQTLRWLRVPGDILFALGAALLGWFVLGLLTGHSFKTENDSQQSAASKPQEELVAR
jgi:nitric oxide reductase subunit B